MFEARCSECVGRVTEPRKFRSGGPRGYPGASPVKPTVWRSRKAAVLETSRRVKRAPPGSSSGACTHRGSRGTRENRHLLAEGTGTGKPVYKKGQALTGELLPLESGANESRRTQGIGNRAKCEVNRDGDAVVLADHSTDGQEVGRLGRWGTETQRTH